MLVVKEGRGVAGVDIHGSLKFYIRGQNKGGANKKGSRGGKEGEGHIHTVKFSPFSR